MRAKLTFVQSWLTAIDDAQALEAALCDARTAARALLGCVLVREDRYGRRAGIIVETEAYLQDDPASHSFGGPRARNTSMFGGAGLAYVYRIHRSFCLNIVTGPAGVGEAVLVRAVEPIEGTARMRRARARASVARTAPRGYALTNGPGKLCQAFGIDLRLDGASLLQRRESEPQLLLLPRIVEPVVASSQRIGISRGVEAELRFFIQDNPWVSR